MDEGTPRAGAPAGDTGDAGGHDDERTEGRLTHVRQDGSAHMVDVSAKPVTARTASAEAVLRTRADVVEQIFDGALPKGDALAVARVAGIMAAKRTPDLVPLCHPLPLSGVSVDFTRSPEAPGTVHITTTVRTKGVTGVEMEALTAASVAALTLYDMIKALDRRASITDVQVSAKAGGASGDWSRT